MKRNHTHVPLLVFALSVFFVVSALYFYVFNATTVSVNRAKLARDIVTTEQNDQNQAKKLSELAAATLFDRSRLTSFFIPADNIVLFITSLESLGSKSGAKVNISSINSDVTGTVNPGTIGHAQAHIEASGSWSSIMSLLTLSEQMPFAVTIGHIRLGMTGIAKNGNNWNISFDAQALVLVPQNASSSVVTSSSN